MSSIAKSSALLVLGIASVGFSRDFMREQAAKEKIAQLPWLQEMDPVDFLGTTALGGLRPIFIDLLWLRFADAYSSKDWYDADAVARLICRLQPNLPRIWDINAYNMAYNISAAKKAEEKPDEAWEWVLRGMDFYKKGMQKNPSSWELPFWLSLLVFNKGSEDYSERFAAAGIGALDEAIRFGRIAASLNETSYECHLRLGFYLRTKIERIEGGEGGAEEKALIPALAEEAVRVYQAVLDRCPKGGDYEDLRNLVRDRIEGLESLRESAKVPEADKPNRSGG